MSLILTRRPTESLMIGDDIRVQIMEVNGRQVRIAIEAPKDIVILRQELYEQQSDDNYAVRVKAVQS